MKNVVDIQSTKQDTMVLTKQGVVHIICDGKAEKKTLKFPASAVQISAGIEHGAILLSNGALYIWGGFENPGFIFRNEYTPTPILPNEFIVEIASGRDHVIALNNKNQIFSLGCGAHGQLGRIPKRSAVDGGRRGPKLLLHPSRVHVPYKHQPDKIWATHNATFYRDAHSGSIFGCGNNSNQNLRPAQSIHEAQDFIYKPVLTMFKKMQEIGEDLALTEDNDVMALKMGGGGGSWNKFPVVGISHIYYGHEETFLFNGQDGEVNEWLGNRLDPLDVMKGDRAAHVMQVNVVNDKIFLLIA